jgi:hypothetical protein
VTFEDDAGHDALTPFNQRSNIGAIRCGDGTGEQDHDCAEAGAVAAGA